MGEMHCKTEEDVEIEADVDGNHVDIWALGMLGLLWNSGHPSSSPPAPRSWPRSSYCSGHSPRLSGVPPNPPCTAPRLMSCLPAFSAHPALCLRPQSQPLGSQFQPCHAKAHLPISQSLFCHCLDTCLRIPYPTPWEIWETQKTELPCSLHNLVSSWL